MAFRALPQTSGEKFPSLPEFKTHYPKDPPSPTASHLQTPAPQGRYPLAAERQQRRHFSQSKCPICVNPILHKQGADFIGNLPCAHRGPCTKPECIQAYYGTNVQSAMRYHGNPRLYCQAPGCGKPLEGWCLVKAVVDPTGKGDWIRAEPQEDLDARKAWNKRQHELYRKEREQREQMRREEPMTATVKVKEPSTDDGGFKASTAKWRKSCGLALCGIVCCPCFFCWCVYDKVCDDCLDLNPFSW